MKKFAIALSVLMILAGCSSDGVTQLSPSPLVAGIYSGINDCTVREVGTDESLQEDVPLTVVIGESGIPLAGGTELFRGREVMVGTFPAIVDSVTVASASVSVIFFASNETLSGSISDVYRQSNSRTITLRRTGLLSGVEDPTRTVILDCNATLTR